MFQRYAGYICKTNVFRAILESACVSGYRWLSAVLLYVPIPCMGTYNSIALTYRYVCLSVYYVEKSKILLFRIELCYINAPTQCFSGNTNNKACGDTRNPRMGPN